MNDFDTPPASPATESFSKRLDELAVLKRKAADAAQTAKEAKYEAEAFERDLFSDMVASDTFSLRTSQGSYACKSTTYAKVNDMDALLAWAEESGHEDWFDMAPRKRVLNEAVRAAIDNGEELPPGVHYYVKEYVSCTAS